MAVISKTEQGELLECVMELARREADILARLTRWRPPGEEQRRPIFDTSGVTADHLVNWARQIAEALITSQGLSGQAGAAAKLWSRVRALMMSYRPDWTVDEFIIYHVTKDQYDEFPFGLAVSDLVSLTGGEFTAGKIRTAMSRLSRRKLIRKCYSKRATVRPGNKIPTREFVWFYAGPGSKYSENSDRVFYMNTPWGERPTKKDSTGSGRTG